MISFIGRRLVAIIPVMLGVSLLVFAMLHLVPGDPVMAMVAEGGASPEQLARVRADLGLDKPIYVQYGAFVARALTGDLGRSFRTRRPVTTEIRSQLGPTVQLAAAATGLAIVLGLTLGTLAAYRHNTWVDSGAMFLAMVGVSIPSFWLGLMMLSLFAVRLGWVPVTGGPGFGGLVLPATTLGLVFSAPIARMTRSASLDVLSRDYVRTARAKGLSEGVVVIRHALANALVPVITLIGIQFGTLLAGTVVIETVFARRGLGSLVVTAILNRDYPLVQGIVFLMAIIFVLTNLLVDIAQVWLDPRLRS